MEKTKDKSNKEKRQENLNGKTVLLKKYKIGLVSATIFKHNFNIENVENDKNHYSINIQKSIPIKDKNGKVEWKNYNIYLNINDLWKIRLLATEIERYLSLEDE